MRGSTRRPLRRGLRRRRARGSKPRRRTARSPPSSPSPPSPARRIRSRPRRAPARRAPARRTAVAWTIGNVAKEEGQWMSRTRRARAPEARTTRRGRDLARTDAAPAADPAPNAGVDPAPNAGADPAPPNGFRCKGRRCGTRRVEGSPRRGEGEVRTRSSWFEKTRGGFSRRGETGRDARGSGSQRARTDAPPPPNMVYEHSTPDVRVATVDAPALGCSIALLEVARSGVGGGATQRTSFRVGADVCSFLDSGSLLELVSEEGGKLEK